LLNRIDVGLLAAAIALILFVVTRSTFRGNSNAVEDNADLGVRELVSQLRSDLISLNEEAIARTKQDGTPPLLTFGGAEVVVSFVVKQDAKGSVKLVTVEAGTGYSTQQIQRLTVKLLPAEQTQSGSSPPDQEFVAVPKR
jgi:Trypsin-co-occurring domain 2